MSPFLIFAISLTIAYAIYYAVMITRDLYGKKEEAKSNEEVFDISNITEEEAAVAVNESDGGFSVADKQYDTSFQDGTSYDEGYGMGTENNGMRGYSPETDSSGREDDMKPIAVWIRNHTIWLLSEDRSSSGRKRSISSLDQVNDSPFPCKPNFCCALQ